MTCATTCERVRALEDAGFQYIWEGDHTLPWQHSAGHSAGIFTTLTAFLSRTERAVVGGMVIPPIGIRHHPIDVAVEIATQALLYPGRVALCVGTGEAMNEKTTTGILAPAQGADRALRRGDRVDQEGLGERGLLPAQGRSTSRASSTSTPSPPSRSRSCAPPRGRSWRGTRGSTPTATSRWGCRRRTTATC